jgi:type II secretory pathway pseudopilin PulG
MSDVPKGFTIIELILIFGLFALMTAIVSAPLGDLLSRSATREAALTVKNTLRRAVTQAMMGLDGDSWGLHLSDTDGCALPARKIHVFRGAFFTSATDTIDTIDLPSGAAVTAVAVGGGCDVKFSRYEGSTTSTGTITVVGTNNETRTITINAYGRITSP